MKRLIITLILLLALGSVAHADVWRVTATSFDPTGADSFWFDVTVGSGVTTASAGDVSWFTGATIYGVTYDGIAVLPDLYVNGLTLMSGYPFGFGAWTFSNSGGTGTYGWGLWTCSATLLSATPIPGAIWLLGTGVLGLFGLRKRLTS